MEILGKIFVSFYTRLLTFVWTGQMPSIVTFLGSLAYLQSACLSIRTSVCNMKQLQVDFRPIFITYDQSNFFSFYLKEVNVTRIFC